MKRACTVLLAAVLVVGLASCGDPIEAGLERAHANDASAEGQAYSEPMRQLVADALQGALRSCITSPEMAPTSNFTIVFAVGEDGTPSQLMVRPESPTMTCVLDGIATAKFPTPPRPDWWVAIEMKAAQ